MLQRLVTPILLVFAATLAPLLAQAQAYQLQPGDRIEISVLEDPALNRGVLVRPDGLISLPLVGTVEAAGRSPEEVAAAIRNALSRDFVTPPTVTVSLVGLGSPELADGVEPARIYVLGEVGRPGPIDVVLPLDILQALSLAGGPGTFAARERIQVRRRVGAEETVMLFDYDLIEDGAVPLERILLADGDVIVVPQRSLFE